MAGAKSRARAAMPSIVSGGLLVSGNLNCDGDLQIEGAVEGDVTSRQLRIGEGGSVKGTVVADEVVIKGTVIGKIKARKVTLAGMAKVRGDVVHQIIVVEAGAEVEGNFKHMAPDEVESLAGNTGVSARRIGAADAEIAEIGPAAGAGSPAARKPASGG